MSSSETIEFNIDVDELNESHIKAPQPNDVNILLKDHQLTLLHRCIQYENETLNMNDFSTLQRTHPNANIKANMAIIGDRVGSGKSYVILSLMKMNDITQKDQTIIKSYGLNNVIYYIPDSKRVVKTNLLVVPHNLTSQWDDYVKKFSSTIKYKVINRQKYVDTLYEENFDIENFDLIIVTGTFYNKVCIFMNEKKIKLQRVIIDEVDNINIPGCHDIHACFTWFLTASYGNILYPRGFSQFDPAARRHMLFATGLRNNGFIRDVFFDLTNHLSLDWIKALVIKNSEAYVEKSIVLPPIYSFIIKCKTPYSINILNGIVDKNIIDCLSANDISSAIQYIRPHNKGTEDNIISMLIEKYKKQLTNLNLNMRMIQQMIFDNDNDRYHEVESAQTKIDAINNKIEMITQRVKETNMCIICYDGVDTNRTVTKCCQNSFCFKCINTWLMNKASCPLCKSTMTSNDYLVINNEVNESEIIESYNEEETHESFDKCKNLKIILKNRKPQSKILIFSSFDQSFVDVIPILYDLRMEFEFLKGSSGQVTNIVKRYKESDLDVLLVNMRNYGSGLNLENTTDVIMFHKESSQSEKQIIGRAHRMGRKEHLNIHYLLYENEVPPV